MFETEVENSSIL